MALQIPIQPVPSQRVLCVLSGQNCQIAIYQKDENVFVDLNSNGVDICVGCVGLNGVPLDSCNSYDGFQGNLYFIDTQGISDPDYSGFGSRWVLVYLTADEVTLADTLPASTIVPPSLMTLSAVLNVIAPAPGNFSVAHGLAVLPSLIEIIQTLPASDSPGEIWGQAGFVDAANVNLVASDTGVTATILIYTQAAAGLTIQVPAATLLVSSPSQPPDTFSVAHGLGAVPSLIEILLTSPGMIWTQNPPYDATHLFLAASNSGVTATISVYGPVTGALNLQAPALILGVTSIVPGAFTVPHGLLAAPSRIEILMLSESQIWAETPAFDTTNIYLQASDTGAIAKILVYA